MRACGGWAHRLHDALLSPCRPLMPAWTAAAESGPLDMAALSLPLNGQLQSGPGQPWPQLPRASNGLDLGDEDDFGADDVGMLDSSILDLLLAPGPVH